MAQVFEKVLDPAPSGPTWRLRGPGQPAEKIVRAPRRHTPPAPQQPPVPAEAPEPPAAPTTPEPAATASPPAPTADAASLDGARCMYCGGKITSAESIARGAGAACAAKHG